MSLPTIGLAGATGNLGLPILSALLTAGYPVTVLSRIGGNSSKLTPHTNLTVKSVDFTSVPSLCEALEGVEVVVSCVATSAMGSQNPLIDACIAAGVRRFIPAEFGMDSQNPHAMQLPPCAMKVATQTYLREQSRLHTEFTWTTIANGLFLDWGIEVGFIIDVKKHTATLYNGGDVLFSATTLADIAKAVVGVVSNQRATADRVVYAHSACVTQNQLIQYVKDKDGKGWDVEVKSTDTVKQESFLELKKGDEGDADAAMLGFAVVGMFDEECGCNFERKLDNGMLGVNVLSADEVRRVVEKCM
ncbi:oxidoreductase CipA-like protein [Paraphoma chrysanthemicola]|uniref:Oxidoreductase CipA-like protein n=1 Tax=Paraphoma chrysanthemicola TaxID=798071 RepID=A0A8K0VZA4_9PLEO|nr:oxidoreductase CipA-like protein [Paraphoma chrysanthemicola]